ncbi:MAG: hypothetical protein R8F63_00680 [Acidimicrobiales bacterium]|nr:hypothetical protein [Acidimicrobiales bacterium]
MPPEDSGTTQTIESVMARLVAGDGDAVADLFELGATPVRRCILATLQEKGIWVDRDRLDDITRDALLELVRIAPGWRADGGAAPWTWARHRLTSLAFDRIGILADEIDDLTHQEQSGASTADVGEPAVVVLRGLEADHDGVRILTDALGRITSERNAAVWLDVLSEEAAGNRSPAETVAQTHDLTAANVRKICQRVRCQLRALAQSEPDFKQLLTLRPLAA